MADDPKQQKERNSGTVKVPDRARTTGSVSSKALAEREREETSFVGPNERMRGTGPQVAQPRPSAPPAERERVTQKMGLARERTTGTISAVNTQPGAATTGPKQLTTHQKSMLSSAFQDAARMNALKAAVGNTGERQRIEDDEDEATSMAVHYDGKNPPKELTARDLFKAVQAPVQSREGRRNKNLYQQVILQFAVGHNPRYEPDAPGASRGHIYVWDVSRAMNVEVPHFVGMKELTLSQTCDWLRHEGPARGWRRANVEDALSGAAQGLLVLALPKEIRLKQLGVVLPEAPDKDGRPRIAGASVKVGGNLSVYEAIGVYAAEYFVHA